MSYGENGRGKTAMTSFPVSSNRQGMKKTSVGIGRGPIKKTAIPYRFNQY
jgi:hypothetical protein